jgi:hypothetical protein
MYPWCVLHDDDIRRHESTTSFVTCMYGLPRTSATQRIAGMANT